MKIKVLGTRGEIKDSAPYHSKHSGVLVNDILLLDCGEKSFLDYQPKSILITHLHPDHAFFVRSRDPQTITSYIYAPESHEDLPIIVNKTPWTMGNYTIIPIPTIHSLKVVSTAYIIEHKEKKILYTGDMIWIEKKYHHLLHNIDLVITEASSIRQGGLIRKDKKTGKLYGHTGVPNLISLFKHFTSNMLFIHFGTWFYQDMKAARKKFKQLAHENDIKIIVGHDGLEVVV